MLTRKQYELLVFIEQRLGESGISPSFDEMKEALSLRSKSGIHRLITGLEERGFIRRLPHRARALEIIRHPENQAAKNAPKTAKTGQQDEEFRHNVVRGNFQNHGAETPAHTSEAIELPFLGRIAAGTPIEALPDHTRAIGVPASMIGSGEHYALEVDGDSMIEAGIQDGDTVIIRRTNTADSGCIVVALVDENEVTLKRLRRKGDLIALEPANRGYETRTFGPERVRVQGRLVGLIRSY